MRKIKNDIRRCLRCNIRLSRYICLLLHLLGLYRGGASSQICTPLITRGSNHVVSLAIITSWMGTLIFISSYLVGGIRNSTVVLIGAIIIVFRVGWVLLLVRGAIIRIFSSVRTRVASTIGVGIAVFIVYRGLIVTRCIAFIAAITRPINDVDPGACRLRGRFIRILCCIRRRRFGFVRRFVHRRAAIRP